MTIFIEREGSEALLPDMDDLIKEVITAGLSYEACPYEAEINVIITTDEQIQTVNHEFRGIAMPTDVLSFPAVDYPSPSDFSEVEKYPMNYINPETEELLLGDIMLSADRAKFQAEEYGHSLKREVAFLIAHSLLHLLGYDHILEEDASLMERKQEEILQSLGIVRE